MTRVLDFSDGFTSASEPTVEPAYPTVSGSPASPTEITASGITVGSDSNTVIYLDSDGGSVDITANPQISAGAAAGAFLTLIGTSDTDSIILQDGNGLQMNGPIELTQNIVIGFTYDGTDWQEVFRNA